MVKVQFSTKLKKAQVSASGPFATKAQLDAKLGEAIAVASELFEANVQLNAKLHEAQVHASGHLVTNAQLEANLGEAQACASSLLEANAHVMPPLKMQRLLPQDS